MKRKELQSGERLEHLLDQFRDVPAREPGAAAAGRQNFLKQAASLRSSLSRRPQPSSTSRTGRMLSQFRGKRRFPVMGSLVAAFLALVAFFGGSAATVYAAQDSLPGGALYGLKTFSEDALLSLTASPQKRLDLTLHFTDRRLTEMASLQSAGRPIPQDVVNRFQSELDKTLELAAGLDDSTMAQSLEQVSLHAEWQLQKMASLMGVDPEAPALVFMHTRLQEQLQAAGMGKSDPHGFRLKVQQQIEDDREETATRQDGPGKPESTPAASDEGKKTGTDRPAETPEPGKHDRENNKPTKTPKSPRQHDPGGPKGTRTPDGDHDDRP